MKNIITEIFLIVAVLLNIISFSIRFSHLSKTERKERKKEIIITFGVALVILLVNIVGLILSILNN